MALAKPKPAVSDYLVTQDWQGYSAAEHATWKTLFDRQQHILENRACKEYLAGIPNDRGEEVAPGVRTQECHCQGAEELERHRETQADAGD